MKEHDTPTPVALYARVSSDRQDVDLSVAAQLRALGDYARKRTIASSSASSWTRPRAAGSTDRPQFQL